MGGGVLGLGGGGGGGLLVRDRCCRDPDGDACGREGLLSEGRGSVRFGTDLGSTDPLEEPGLPIAHREGGIMSSGRAGRAPLHFKQVSATDF